MSKLTNDTPCVVETDKNYVWNFYGTVPQAEFVRDKMNKEEGVKKYSIMNYEEYLKVERAKWITGKITEIDEDKFWYALEVLPPMGWKNNGVLETFYMSEFMSGTYTEQYACFNDKYYCKMIDVTDASTEITIADLQKLQEKG